MSEAITFLVPGTPLTPGEATPVSRGATISGVRVGVRRAGGETMRLTAQPGQDVVLVRIANGPALYLHPETARDMMRAQVGGEPLAARGAEGPRDEVIVPAQLSWRGLETPAAATRGGLLSGIGNALIDTIEVITGSAKEKAAELATDALLKKIDGQVNPGVYALSADELPRLKEKGRKIDAMPPAPDGKPILVLAHGTFVDTASTFGKLWTLHPARVRELFAHYGGRVYALDHPTVGESPFANALTLAETLPERARLHLVTHSRGGLVAEVLARIAGGEGLRPQDLARFEGPEYARHRADIAKLAKLARQKQFQVDRTVRVACPARGTLLASRRLDAYLSVLKWSLELASVPVLPDLVDFLHAIARQRTNPEKLPGLEAMMPGKPVAEWLNAAADPVPGDLRVVAGDIEGDSIGSWIKTLLSDAFYWADNDLVVQTRSMYGGTIRREGAASFMLDRGGKVTHFNYFANERTVGAIVNGLIQPQPVEFQPIGPLSWQGEDSSGTRSALAAKRSGAGEPAARPAVFVLPGILGSHLKVDGKRIWLSVRFLNNLDLLKWDPQAASRVEPDGPIGTSYDDLIEYLADTHEVVPFAFDWRRPIEDEAHRLADAIEEKLAVRALTRQPVRIVAHSMGGVVARTMRLERPETWKRMLARDGARVLMLGTPNGGSWAPMQVLSGDDTFGNILSALGTLFDGYEARRTMAGMTGLIQLQASLLDPALGLRDVSGWQRLEDADLKPVLERASRRTWWHNSDLQINSYRWGVPSADALERAVRLRKRLDEQRDALGADAAKMLLVVGKARTTPSGIEATDAGVRYLDVRDEGDGRVTLESACLPGVRTWQVEVAHGDLADAKNAFAGYLELLTGGDTKKIDRVPEGRSVGRAAGAVLAVRPAMIPSRPSRTMKRADPPVTQREVFAPADTRVIAASAAAPAPLRVSIVNGNLKFVRHALLLGHYRSLRLTGTEAVMDGLIEGAMSRSLRAGLYPSTVGTHQVFVNMWRNPDDPFVMPRPAAVVVVGLGEEGTLRAADLVATVRQATLAYAQRMSESASGVPITFDLAATLIGTGGIGMQIGTAAQSIVQGVAQANERLAPADGSGTFQWPVVGNLQLIELYLDRATEAHHALASLAAAYPQRFTLEREVKAGQGGLPRPVAWGYRGAGYDFITVQRRGGHGSDSVIEFTLDTQRARSEVRGQATQIKLVDELVRVGADDRNRNTQIGRTLFQLLVPIELGPFLSDSASVLLQLDSASAAIPWELLDTQQDESTAHDTRPWAVRTRMLRKLRTATFRSNPADTRADDAVLVIGEPLCDPQTFPPLPGAAAEAAAVAEVLGVEPRLHLDALTVVNAAFERPYRVIHVAGHGIYFRDGTGGVALSNDTVFGPREVAAMRAVPELAFINCCHLGRIEADTNVKAATLGDKRPLFAANLAEELIKNGVRCVVAAGWAVDDHPAQLFATRFYRALLRGSPFAEAVGLAREETHRAHPDSNTWAAYQCYGDPDWRYRRNDGDSSSRASQDPGFVTAEELALQLETFSVQSRFGGSDRESTRTRLQHLEALYAERWGGRGIVAQGFGDAYSEIRDFKRAIEWYARAVTAEDGKATLRAGEQLGNLRARLAAEASDNASGGAEVQAATRLLEHVYAIGATSERANLLGSALKRQALLESAGGDTVAARKSIEAMAAHYRCAEKLALQNRTDNPYYPALNRIAAELILKSSDPGWSGFDPADVATVRQSLQRKVTDDADFWSVVNLTELRIYEALAQRRLASGLGSILKDLADLKARADAPRMWASVYDQARFTLSPSIESKELADAERNAAQRLLLQLADYASQQQKAPTHAQGAQPDTPRPANPEVKSRRAARSRRRSRKRPVR